MCQIEEELREQLFELEKSPHSLHALLLLNDNINDMIYIVDTLVAVFRFTTSVAFEKMMCAHTNGKSLLLISHIEKLEHYKEQLAYKNVASKIIGVDD